MAALREFAVAQKLGYRLLSDSDGSVAEKYGVLAEGGRHCKRVTFVIDPKGLIRHIDREVKVASHGKDLAEAIRRLKG